MRLHTQLPTACVRVRVRVCVCVCVVRHVRKDERKYYEELLKYSRDHLMLYPYHLSDIMVKGLRVTPFSYYIGIMEVRLRTQGSGFLMSVSLLGPEAQPPPAHKLQRNYTSHFKLPKYIK